MGPSYLRQVVHPRPQTPQGGPVAKSEILHLIIIPLVCNSDMKGGHCILLIYSSKRMSVVQETIISGKKAIIEYPFPHPLEI